MDLSEITMKTIGPTGAMISASKSGYRDRHPNNLAVFNANIFIRKPGNLFKKDKYEKIWFGDIDITLSREKLQELSKLSGYDIYVLYEMDGRFDNEDNPSIGNFVYKCAPDGTDSLGKKALEQYLEKTLLAKDR